jgi:hypothetical protein
LAFRRVEDITQFGVGPAGKKKKKKKKKKKRNRDNQCLILLPRVFSN